MFGASIPRGINPRDKLNTPGPGDYELVPYDKLRSKNPAFTMGVRRYLL